MRHQPTKPPVTPASIPTPPQSPYMDPSSTTIQSTPAAPAKTTQLPRMLACLLPHNANGLKEFQQSSEPSHDAPKAPAAVRPPHDYTDKHWTPITEHH